MSCFPCVECGDGYSITRENIDRWSDSVANVLASSEGRLHFKRFLESRELDESYNTVEFWERCVRIMPTKSEGGDSPPHTSSVPHSSSSSSRSSLAEGSSSYWSGHQFHHTKRSSPPRAAAVTDKLRLELKLLYEFADYHDVNLDLAQMRILYKMQDMTDEESVIVALSQAKQSAMELLADDYQLFREHLLKSQGLFKR